MTVIDAAFSPPFCPRSSLIPEAWPWQANRSAADCWAQWAQATAQWLKGQNVDPREAVVIVPVGAVLTHARRAWGEHIGGWAPAVETVASLIAAHGWRHDPTTSVAGKLTMDLVMDRLTVTQRLQKETWSKQWASRDPRGFEHAMEQVVDAAHSWVRRAQSIAPDQREAYWQHARDLLGAQASGAVQYGSREKLLLAFALEWVIDSMAAGWPTDVMFDLPFKAYVGVSAGEAVSPGTEAHLMLGVMARALEMGVPCLWSVAVADSAQRDQAGDAPAQLACVDAEDEARHAAAVVLQKVNESRLANGEPVALIALDRSLVRRVRAMLDGAGASVADETGWRLSTTRAAAVVTRMLQAAHSQASTDDLLDWLKSGWVQLDQLGDQLGACDDLESWCRQHGWLRAWDAPTLLKSGKPCPDAAVELWQHADRVTQAYRTLRSGKRRPLRQWVQALLDMLKAAQAWDALVADEAGALVTEALHLSNPGLQDETTWQQLLDQMMLDGGGFGRWVHEVLENTTFRPAAPEGRIDVVITPMARAVLRPFHAIVMPGADARQLGSMGSNTSWLGQALTRKMMLATPDDLRQSQWEALCLLLSRPSVVCLYRKGQGTEPMEASPWLTRWANESGQSWQTWVPQWAESVVSVAAEGMPEPVLGEAYLKLMPKTLSATSYEALRQCPYRFFAQSVLKLKDADELEEGLDRSDYGTWLHEVIRRFHVQREQMLAIRTPEEDVQAWLSLADEVIADMGLDSDVMRPYFLPYKSVLPAMARAYVAWLHEHEKEGWRCVDNESSHKRAVLLDEDTGSIDLNGQIDRIDSCYRDGRRARMVIDYKSGSLPSLKEKVKVPLEDTQLPFYGVLHNDGITDAAYLHLDAKGATLVRHADVADHAEQLLDGLIADMTRIKQGAAMPALGEGSACTYCAARGLCRKDHWPLAQPHQHEVAA